MAVITGRSLLKDWSTNIPYGFVLMQKLGEGTIVQEHVKGVIKRDKSSIVLLLDLFVGKAWGMGTGIAHKTDFEREQYDSVTRIFDANFIISAIHDYLGREPELGSDFPESYDQKDENITLKQFAWIHRNLTSIPPTNDEIRSNEHEES